MSKFKKNLGRSLRIKIPVEKLKGYFRENWGAPAIICFMALLVTAALLLAGGMKELADAIAVYAYYSLVIGVVLQLICYVKFGSKEDDD